MPITESTLLGLPWKSADEPPEYLSLSNATFLVITAPVVGGTGRIGSDLYIAHYRGKGRWTHFQSNLPTDGHEIREVAVWLDVSGWDLEKVVAAIAPNKMP